MDSFKTSSLLTIWNYGKSKAFNLTPGQNILEGTHTWTEVRLNPTWLYLNTKDVMRTPSSQELRNESPLDIYKLALIFFKGQPLDQVWIRAGLKRILMLYLSDISGGGHFEAPMEGVFIAPLDSSYTQVGFSHTSVQVWVPSKCLALLSG